MPVILNKSKILQPKPMKEIRYIGHPERKFLQMSKDIAREFGVVSKKNKPKKIILR